MCRFKSSIETRDGRIIHHELTDSHEDLLILAGITERNDSDVNPMFVRLEFCPVDNKDLADPGKYELVIDGGSRPSWFTEEREHAHAEFLRGVIRSMLVTDERKLLMGGAWILAGKANAATAKSCRIVAMRDSAKVGAMRDSAKVDAMYDSANVGAMRDSAKVGAMYGSAKVVKDNRSEAKRT